MHNKLVVVFRDNIKLILILIGLCASITVLVVSVIVVANNPAGNIVDEASYNENEQAAAEYEDYLANERKIEREVDKLLDSETKNIAAVNKIYRDAISEAINSGRSEDAYGYMDSREEAYLSRGMKKELLEAMKEDDYSGLDESDQYRRYARIVKLAEELGDNDTVSQYEKLMAETKEAYDLDYAAVERTVRAAEAIMGEYEEGEEEE